VAVPGLRRLVSLYQAVESGAAVTGWHCLDALADSHASEAGTDH
jgi:hypothetical protein